jgi:hypothetical protein
MSAYGDYLKKNGATEDEIKVLVNPASERAFSAMQADLTAATTARTAAEAKSTTYEKWYNEKAVPYVQKLERDIVTATANEGRARTALVTAQKRGLLNVAQDLGYDLNDPNATPPNTPPGTPPAAGSIDTSKFIDKDTFLQSLSREGDAIASAQDIAIEHSFLFGGDPTKKLNFRELRNKALANGKSVEQQWMDDNGVIAARAAREAADRTAYETRLRNEGAEAERTRLATVYGDPNQRPPMPSQSPFAQRPQTGREKQPWERGDDGSMDRVTRATQKVIAATARTN